MNLLEPEFYHKDSRRSLSQIFTADIRQVNVYEAKKDAILGDHYHKETVEFFYLAKGTILYNDSTVVNRGNTFVVYPMERHTLKCMTDVTLVSFLSKPYSQGDPDIWKKESS